jgi:hypothetical protein
VSSKNERCSLLFHASSLSGLRPEVDEDGTDRAVLSIPTCISTPPYQHGSPGYIGPRSITHDRCTPPRQFALPKFPSARRSPTGTGYRRRSWSESKADYGSNRLWCVAGRRRDGSDDDGSIEMQTQVIQRTTIDRRCRQVSPVLTGKIRIGVGEPGSDG